MFKYLYLLIAFNFGGYLSYLGHDLYTAEFWILITLFCLYPWAIEKAVKSDTDGHQSTGR